MTRTFRGLNLGVGVQSTTVYILALQCPQCGSNKDEDFAIWTYDFGIGSLT